MTAQGSTPSAGRNRSNAWHTEFGWGVWNGKGRLCLYSWFSCGCTKAAGAAAAAEAGTGGVCVWGGGSRRTGCPCHPCPPCPLHLLRWTCRCLRWTATAPRHAFPELPVWSTDAGLTNNHNNNRKSTTPAAPAPCQNTQARKALAVPLLPIQDSCARYFGLGGATRVLKE